MIRSIYPLVYATRSPSALSTASPNAKSRHLAPSQPSPGPNSRTLNPAQAPDLNSRLRPPSQRRIPEHLALVLNLSLRPCYVYQT